MKKQDKISLNFTLVTFTFFIITLNIYAQNGNKSAQLVEKWKVGTSSGIFVDFSQEEFYQARKDGISYLELNARILSI